jgi:hypothetical protein
MTSEQLYVRKICDITQLLIGQLNQVIFVSARFRRCSGFSHSNGFYCRGAVCLDFQEQRVKGIHEDRLSVSLVLISVSGNVPHSS